MKTAIIGAGNMGGSIARGLAKGTIIPANDIIVSNPTQHKLDVLKAMMLLCLDRLSLCHSSSLV